MKSLFRILLLMLAITPAAAQEPKSAQCPAPRSVPVLMPPEAVRMEFKGEVQVSVRFDACGVVTEAKVTKRSRLQSVNDAALKSAKLMVLSAEDRAKAVDGWYTRTYNFEGQNEPKDIKQVAVAWPESYKRPKYVLDGSDIGYSSVANADQAIVDSVPNVVHPPVYDFVHRLVQVNTADGAEFWLFISAKGSSAVAARYRPRFEDGKPVVQLALKCELEAQQCEAVRELLMRGLPFAPAG